MFGLSLWMTLSICTCPFLNLILPYLHGFFLLILAHCHTDVHCLILPLFPCIRQSVIGYTLYHVSLCTFFVIGHVLLSRQIVGISVLCVIFLFHNVLCVMCVLLLLIYHFQSLLSDLPSTVRVIFTNKLSSILHIFWPCITLLFSLIALLIMLFVFCAFLFAALCLFD